MSHEDIIYKNTCSKWVNKLTGEVIYMDGCSAFGLHNPNWVLMPKGAMYATYSNNEVRSDVTLFWRDCDRGNNVFDPKLPEKGWFKSAESLRTFLTEGTYKGKIVWSLFK